MERMFDQDSDKISLVYEPSKFSLVTPQVFILHLSRECRSKKLSCGVNAKAAPI